MRRSSISRRRRCARCSLRSRIAEDNALDVLDQEALKNTSDDPREVVTNFDALRARYAGTRYEPMFNEVVVP